MIIGKTTNDLINNIKVNIKYLEEPKYLIVSDEYNNEYYITKSSKGYQIYKGQYVELYTIQNNEENLLNFIRQKNIKIMYEKILTISELKKHLKITYNLQLESIIERNLING